ncbi:MAG: transcriptional regulator, ArsR family [Candidatus Angelobacter sp.]|nr:transcriptional regulator, ArsR family [Candidatus Angelobacter sp.]
MPAPVNNSDKLDPVWKALSDPTRRAMLDILRDGPRTTTEVVDAFPRLSRFGVMKHLEVLRKAGLVQTRESGRQRVNSLNAVPIRQIYERWVGPFQELWTGHLLGLKEAIEEENSGGTRKSSRRSKTKKE